MPLARSTVGCFHDIWLLCVTASRIEFKRDATRDGSHSRAKAPSLMPSALHRSVFMLTPAVSARVRSRVSQLVSTSRRTRPGGIHSRTILTSSRSNPGTALGASLMIRVESRGATRPSRRLSVGPRGAMLRSRARIRASGVNQRHRFFLPSSTTHIRPACQTPPSRTEVRPEPPAAAAGEEGAEQGRAVAADLGTGSMVSCVNGVLPSTNRRA